MDALIFRFFNGGLARVEEGDLIIVEPGDIQSGDLGFYVLKGKYKIYSEGKQPKGAIPIGKVSMSIISYP